MSVQTPSIIIQPSTQLFRLGVKALWQYRELLYFLAWRDLKARYAQTIVGLAWAVLQPLAMMIVFTIVFSHLARLPSDGIPYPIFAYAALVPWSYVAKSLDRAGFSVVAESNLITKVYFPRMIVPFSATLGGLVDFGIAFILLFAMMIWFGIPVGWQIVALPFFVLMIVTISTAVSLWLAALYVRYRDVGALVPLLTQVWMFASPIVYPVSIVPKDWQWLYSMNPIVGVIQGFRWTLLGAQPPDPFVLMQNMIAIGLILIGGMAYFNRMERTFADVI
ncbi:transport permease protein [Nitrospira sp.]|nr:transport permease protein [Nitrospira sp.]